MMPLKLRLVFMALAGFGVGTLLAHLPWWAAVTVLVLGIGWAVWMLVSVQRDLKRIQDELETWALREQGQ